ncbi:acyl-CoA thioesterase [Snuella lapsa]|uniref:Thioesterase superfamily protein n=1 Tax=Snuella lapsa TaxID=870481 RepID=A0ABP6XLK7_9FLAO
MFYYWLHVIYIYISSKLFLSKVDVDSEITRHRRVSILDCEGFRYMSNSRYCYYMDFIRYELLFRTKLYTNTFSKGMFGVLGSQKVIYKKPLKRWSKFSITLYLEGWDDKWAYHRQVFRQNNKVCAIGYTKLAFVKNRELQSMKTILNTCGYKGSVKPPSSMVLDLFKNDQTLLSNEDI